MWPEWKKVERKEIEKKGTKQKRQDQDKSSERQNKTGETTVFATKKAQPKITDQFQRIDKSKAR